MPEIVKQSSKNAHWHRPDRKKRCILCDEIRSLSEFYSYSYTTNQGKLSTRYESRCKLCSRSRSKVRHKAIRSQAIAAMQLWRAHHPDEVIAQRRRYQQSEHGRRVKARNQRIRAARTNAGSSNRDPRIAALYREAADWEQKLAACVISDDPLDLKVHVDHKQPLSKGGKHVFDNLQILDARINMQKGATPHSAWTGEANA